MGIDRRRFHEQMLVIRRRSDQGGDVDVVYELGVEEGTVPLAKNVNDHLTGYCRGRDIPSVQNASFSLFFLFFFFYSTFFHPFYPGQWADKVHSRKNVYTHLRRSSLEGEGEIRFPLYTCISPSANRHTRRLNRSNGHATQRVHNRSSRKRNGSITKTCPRMFDTQTADGPPEFNR